MRRVRLVRDLRAIAEVPAVGNRVVAVFEEGDRQARTAHTLRAEVVRLRRRIHHDVHRSSIRTGTFLDQHLIARRHIRAGQRIGCIRIAQARCRCPGEGRIAQTTCGGQLRGFSCTDSRRVGHDLGFHFRAHRHQHLIARRAVARD